MIKKNQDIYCRTNYGYDNDFDCQWIEVLYNPCFTVVMINNSLILKGNNISCII